MRRSLTLCAAAALLVLAGCSTYDSVTGRMIGAVTPYRINIVQGNFVSKEAYDQLAAGMTRDQVRLLLGTPLLADMFHANRWDYVFYFKRGNTAVVQERHLALYFDGDSLAKWEGGNDLPSEYELVQEIDGQKRGKSDKPAAAPAAASAAAAAPSTDASASAPAAAPDAPASAVQSVPAAAAPAVAPASAESPATVPSPPVTASGGKFSMPK
ncbi:Outer membrane protein assembly factor BamE [Pandoraea terrae]|uniref:Outer membrane protein assembly factor BamE n=1 Tax=Pandoraea terrae TaxID=1537710 RepID=A0A5E4Z3L4_9BURK|nr:outer membrane protein assembly factor BamE [Pandoraea terrae]VVE55764.1 Outer membrane protein assembly factor BamE [Pandoraea terrae]